MNAANDAPFIVPGTDAGAVEDIILDAPPPVQKDRFEISTVIGPIVMLGTKCPSITSTWIQSAPAASIARTSSPSREKSAERMEGEISGAAMTA